MNILANFTANKRNKLILTYAATLLVFALMWVLIPKGESPSGILLFTPVIFMLFFIFLTRRIIEGFMLSILLMTFMQTQSVIDMFPNFINSTYQVMSGEDFQWIVFVSSCVGAIIALIKDSGSIHAFSKLVLRFSKTKRSTLVSMWFLNLLTFFDEYLHFMVMGPATLPIAKKRNISKEYLTYIMKSTGVAFGVLLPISIWALFIAKQFEGFEITSLGEGIQFFGSLIALNFFAWISVLISFLVVIGLIPIFGPMKKAEERAEQGIYSNAGEEDEEEITPEMKEKYKKSSLFNFFFPLALLFGLIIYFDFDSAKGALIALFISAIYYVIRGLLTPADCENSLMSGGIKSMVYLFVIILLAFMFSSILETLGFIDYVIELVNKSNIHPGLLPVALFVIFAFIEFAVSLNWGLFVLVFPMMLPMANSVGADPNLCIAAVLSATIFGVNTSPISESTIMPCAFTNTDPMDHTMANLPYQLIPFGLSVIAFLIAGFVML